MISEVESKALALPERARALRIIDTPSFQAAGAMLVDIKGLRAEIDAAFDPTISAAHNAHKVAVAAKKKVSAPLAEAEGILKGQMGAYQTEQERQRAEAQRRIDDEVKRLAEDARIKSAVSAEAAGLHDVAERIIDAPLIVNAPTVAPVAKVEGVSFREVWHAEVTDMVSLVRYCAANPMMIPLLLTVNQTALNQMVRTQKNELTIPGVKVIREKSVSATATKEPW